MSTARPKSQRSLSGMVDEYKRDYMGNTKTWRRRYKSTSSHSGLVKLIFSHPHRARILSTSKKQAMDVLVANESDLNNVGSFDAILDLVTKLIGDIFGIGKLTCYDVANGIAARRGIQPKHIWLHAGTKAGAKKMGLEISKPYLPMNALPACMWSLPVWACEDFLCFYGHDD